MIMYLFRILVFLCCAFSLVIAFFFWLIIKDIGFPDGHITDFDRVKKVVNSIGIFISFMFSGYSIYTGVFNQKKNRISMFVKCLLGYSLMLMGLFIVIDLLEPYFNNGRGG